MIQNILVLEIYPQSVKFLYCAKCL